MSTSSHINFYDLLVTSFRTRPGAGPGGPAAPGVRPGAAATLNSWTKEVIVSSYRDGGGAGPEMRPYPGTAAIRQHALAERPGGVDLIVVGAALRPGYRIVDTTRGIIAILIGLLAPALQAMEREGSPEGHTLRSALAPGGRLWLLRPSGELHDLGGRYVRAASPHADRSA